MRLRHRCPSASAATVCASLAECSPAELILLAYDRIGCQLRDAEMAIAAGQTAALTHAIQQATDLISQGLVASLDVERGGDIARKLGLIYDFALRKLVQASLWKDADVVRELAVLFGGLRPAWVVRRPDRVEV